MRMRLMYPVLIAVLTIAGASSVFAQNTPQSHEHHSAAQAAPPAAGAMHSGSMECCQKMFANLAATDAKLDELVAKMDSAEGDLKVAAVAEVVKAIVAQQKEMREMMSHMMGHPEGNETRAACPMGSK